jgi:hypothetical protein
MQLGELLEMAQETDRQNPARIWTPPSRRKRRVRPSAKPSRCMGDEGLPSSHSGTQAAAGARVKAARSAPPKAAAGP